WRALAAGAWATAWDSRTRGASTLTMQLAGLLHEDLARPAGGRSVGQKLTQMHRARQLENGWSKTQILEAYLNRVPLRGELVGVAAASHVLFGKHASGLDAVEAALLASMVRGPNAGAPLLERRACEVLRQQQLDCVGLGITLAQALARRPGALLPAQGEALAPHLARLMKSTPAAAAGKPLRSTLDAGVQRVALHALRRQIAELRGREVEDGAIVVLDNASGEVLAWVGSSGSASNAPAVDAVLARRQPGSTVKPFVYALALQQRLLTAASRLNDAPLQLAAGAALYQPQNYDGGFQGPVSVRTALASSLNVPAVRVGAMLGPDAVFAGLTRAGLRPSESGGYHGHALALGSAEVSLLDLTNAYRLFAQRGQWSPVRWQAGAAARGSVALPLSLTPLRGELGAARSWGHAEAPRRVFDASTAWIVADILADNSARAITFGLDSALATRGWAAVKTGTSKDLRDNWCLGFTDRYTVGVWVGNASGAPMHGVSGASGAAPVWRELGGHLPARTPSRHRRRDAAAPPAAQAARAASARGSTGRRARRRGRHW
ncbi:MAG TPA: transglycosylase domain-containing protein, partial [Rubrivivax sp.]|nr:transglycosylase domain-containing protein [Rubrivivax sp.]